MRHRKARTKLGRVSAHRKAMMRNLATELIRHEKIRTTQPKARALRSSVAKLITLAKRQDLAARRRVLRQVKDEDVVSKLFGKLSQRYAEREGGYTRLYRLGPRRGDGAEMAVIELVDRGSEETASPEASPGRPGLRERLFGSRGAAPDARGAGEES